MLIHLFIFIIAFLINTISALSGGGAGIVQLPVLLFLDLSYPSALATHKLANCALGVGSFFKFIKSFKLEKQILVALVLVGAIGVYAGSFVIKFLNQEIAEIFLAIIMLVIFVHFRFEKKLKLDISKYKLNNFTFHAIGCLGFFIIGFINGTVSSGAGILAIFWLTFWYRLTYQSALFHTLIFIGIFYNLVGAILLDRLFIIDLKYLPALAFGAFFGGYFGANLINKHQNYIKTKIIPFIVIVFALVLIT